MARIAMPLGQDFEDEEFKFPYNHFRDAHHEVMVLGRNAGDTIHGKNRRVLATVQVGSDALVPEDYDALVIAGGYSPDDLRTDSKLVEFVTQFATLERPIAAICHGPQLLIEAKLVQGRTLTSWSSVRTDLENAGAHWIDQPVCVDGNLITSCKPEDLEAFTEAILARLHPTPALPFQDTMTDISGEQRAVKP